MGVVKRQGIKQSIVNYIGVGIGALSTFFVYTTCFTESQLGIVKYITEWASVFAFFAMLGSGGMIVRFFPIFKNEKNGHNGFLAFIFGVLIAGCLLLLGGYLLFENDIESYFAAKPEDADLYLQFFRYLVPITFLMGMANSLSFYISNFQRIVVPSIFLDLFPKIGLPLLAIAYYFGAIGFPLIFPGLVIVYALIVVGLLGYTKWLGELHLWPDFSFLRKELLGKIATYNLYGFLGGLGNRFAGGVLSFLFLGTLDTAANAGIFVIPYFIASVIDVPRRAISKITAPLLADKWEKGLLTDISDLYHRSSLNQFIVGLGLLVAIWVSVDELFAIMPNGAVFAAGKYVVLILGIAKVVDMMTGVNSEIIANSKYYQFNFYLVLVLAVANVAASFWLIPWNPLIGAAMATLISITLYNLMKYLVLWWKMGIQPFTWPTLWVLLIGGAAYLAAAFLPKTGWAILDAIIGSGVAGSVFGGLVLYFRVSPDLNDLVKKIR